MPTLTAVGFGQYSLLWPTQQQNSESKSDELTSNSLILWCDVSTFRRCSSSPVLDLHCVALAPWMPLECSGCFAWHATHAESAFCVVTLLCHLALFHPSQMQNHLKVLKRRLDQGSYIKLVGLVEQCCVAPLAFPSSMVLCHGLANPRRNWIWNSLTKMPVANVAASQARRCARKFWTSPPSVDAWPRKSVAHTLLTF